MAMPVSKFQGVNGLQRVIGAQMNTPIVKGAIGFATGGVGGAVLGTISKPGSPAAGVMSAYSTGKSLGNIGESSPSMPNPDVKGGLDLIDQNKPKVESDYNPMQAKADSLADPSDHRETLRRGLAALGHPDVPQELRDEYAEPMLTAYHFGGPRRA